MTDSCLNGAEGLFARSRRRPRAGPPGRWCLEPRSPPSIGSSTNFAGRRSWEARHPFVDATYRRHRLHAAFPPLALRAGILSSLFFFSEKIGGQLRAPETARSLGRSGAAILLEAVLTLEDSIVVSALRGSGKPTLAVTSWLPCRPTDGFIALEDTP